MSRATLSRLAALPAAAGLALFAALPAWAQDTRDDFRWCPKTYWAKMLRSTVTIGDSRWFPKNT